MNIHLICFVIVCFLTFFYFNICCCSTVVDTNFVTPDSTNCTIPIANCIASRDKILVHYYTFVVENIFYSSLLYRQLVAISHMHDTKVCLMLVIVSSIYALNNQRCSVNALVHWIWTYLCVYVIRFHRFNVNALVGCLISASDEFIKINTLVTHYMKN